MLWILDIEIEELGKLRDTWTKKSQLFDTTYHHDILNKTVKK